MHGRDGMSASTRDRVLEVASELGWVPDGRARGLVTKRAGIVGVLFHDFDSTGETGEESALYVDQVIRGAEGAATAAGDAVLIAATRGRTGRELAFSIAGKVDGLVVLATSISKADLTALSRSLPIVTIANRTRNNPYDDISVDNRGAMRALVDHLVDVHGCTSFAFMAGPPRTPDSTERFAGFCDAVRAHGLPEPPSPTVVGGFTEHGGAEAMRTLLADGRRPAAVVCANDEMAIGALRVLRAAKIAVPAAIAVTGFDDIATARHIRPALTTVRQPMREVGKLAVEMLLSRIAEPIAPRRAVVLATEPRVRRSCGCGVRASTTRNRQPRQHPATPTRTST
jgi:LacI family transcriptional regulator, galactose operon repressor